MPALLRNLVATGILSLVASALSVASTQAEPAHGIAMIGEPGLPPDFQHLPYVNPNAPKTGRITYGVIGAFDSMNPFIVQGGTNSARGLREATFGNLIYESLLTRSDDEPFTLYGLIAETVETPPDRSWVEFTLNPLARFSDGEPITVEDVIFSLEILRDKGRPNYKAYYSKVERIERIGERGIRFHISEAGDRELPLILGLMPIIPKHVVDPDTFSRSTLKPIIGSGPYIPTLIDAPDRIVYKRNPDYWAKDLPIKRGLDNYDEIRIEYYRDTNTLFEAFKKGLFDVYPEGDPSQWNTGYNFPAVANGSIVRETFRTGTPKGMSGFVFNTRRPIFTDVRVRRALARLFDFGWVNKNLYYDAYVRSGGYFADSELSSLGRPASERERELLAPFPDAVPENIMQGTWAPPSTDGAGGARNAMREALAELGEAGYRLEGNRLIDANGRQLAFEIMVTNKEDERLALAYQRTLSRVGIRANIRTVDSAQYEQRRRMFDFDMIRFTWGVSLSPGNEQLFRWSQSSAESEGSYNYPGASSPAIDAMIEAMLAADTRKDFVAAVRALDRLLIAGHYAVPLFYLPEQWLARWTRVERPDTTPVTGYNLPSWWAKPNG